MTKMMNTFEVIFPEAKEPIASISGTTPQTTIINKATYEAEYADKSSASLLFEEDMWDCGEYVDKTKLRKTLNLNGRGKILHILVQLNDDPLFVNVANKDVEYEHPVFVDEGMDGAYKRECFGRHMWVTKHPVGNVIVVVK
jgi:hypothetical protein